MGLRIDYCMQQPPCPVPSMESVKVYISKNKQGRALGSDYVWLSLLSVESDQLCHVNFSKSCLLKPPSDHQLPGAWAHTAWKSSEMSF